MQGAFLALLVSGAATGPLAAQEVDPSRTAGALRSAVDAPRSASTADENGASNPNASGFNPTQLEGPDQKVAELAAARLLVVISSQDAQLETARATHLAYLLERLSTARLTRLGADAAQASLTAERIVDALATWITSSGPPFPTVPEVLLPLLGEGGPRLREVVIRALKAQILHEEKAVERRESLLEPQASARAGTIALIAGRLAGTDPPTPVYIRDAAQILWDTDKKALLGGLLETLRLYSKSLPGSPAHAAACTSVEELSQRVALDFPSAEAWQKWWTEAKDLPLERILADSQRRTREAFAANWRQLLKRLRETEDAERVLLALQDTLDTVYSLELRLAGVTALGDFAEWVQEIRLRPAGAESTPEGDPRDRLAAKAAHLLLALFDRRGFPPERPEVLRAAVTALRKHHAFLERSPHQLAQVARVVVERIEAYSALPGVSGQGADDLLETLRLAGALRVAGALPFVLAILGEAGTSEPADLEGLTAAVNTLGRLLEKGMTREASSLVLGQFRQQRSGPEKPLRELKRACVTALSTGSEIPEVREVLRRFHEEILAGTERELKIPAILGLGTLARQKDTEAFQILTGVLLRHEQFETEVAAAAMDSVAYVGGPAALTAFLKCLPRLKDKTLADHLWKKLVTAVQEDNSVGAGRGAQLVWVLRSMIRLALEEGADAYLEHAARLGAEPTAQAAMALDKLDLSQDARVGVFWETNLAFAEVKDLLGDEEGMEAALTRLTELAKKAPEVKDKLPEGFKALSAWKTVLALRAAIRPRFANADAAEPAPLVKDLEALVEADLSLTGRWRNLRWIRRLLSAEPLTGTTDGLVRLRELWRQALSREDKAAVWAGFPASFRETHLSRLQPAGR